MQDWRAIGVLLVSYWCAIGILLAYGVLEESEAIQIQYKME